MADGAPLGSTVLTLSHWPASPTPVPLRADLSAEIAFRYLASRRRWPPAEAVTSDHFDQDGAVTVFVLTDPDAALRRRHRLIEVAAAGDFSTCTWREAARISFAIAAYADPARSPLHLGAANPALDGLLHEEVLRRLADMIDRPDAYRSLWEDEDRFLEDSEHDIASGVTVIDELPALDLAVVTSGAPWRPASQFTRQLPTPCHPIAVHNSTAMSRILTLSPGRYELRQRYETWVRLMSRRPRPRVDLTALADELSAADACRWEFNGVGATVARMAPTGESRLDPDAVRSAVVGFLSSDPPPAWDPYREAAE